MAETVPDIRKLRIDRSRRAGRSGGCLTWVLLVALLGVVVAWLLQDRWRPLAEAQPWWPVSSVVVETGRVTRVGGAPPPTGVAANGYVVARRQAALSTVVQGRIAEMLVEEGDRVAAGDTIARLDVEPLEASLAAAEADARRAAAQLRRAELEVARLEPLVAEELAQRADLDRALADRDAAQAQLEAAEARADEVSVQIEKASVLAPFGGVVTRKNAEVGEVVSAIGATGPNARGAVATLVDFDTLEVQVELAQTALSAAEVGAPVSIFLDAYPDDAIPGRVRQIWPTADRQKGTVELRVGFDAVDERVLPEMSVRVVFLDEDVPDEPTPVEVLVPQRALRSPDTPSVFVVRDGRAVRVSFEPKTDDDGVWRRREDRVAVASGLSGGEVVVLDPPAELSDGDAVRIEEGTPR